MKSQSLSWSGDYAEQVSYQSNSGDIVPARQLLSDNRIKSFHGNNIFIFQGHRFFFISIQLQVEQTVFFLCKVSFVSSGIWKEEREIRSKNNISEESRKRCDF